MLLAGEVACMQLMLERTSTWLPAPRCLPTRLHACYQPWTIMQQMGQLHLHPHCTGLRLHAGTPKTSTATCGAGSSCCGPPRGRGTRSTASPQEMQTRCCTSPRCQGLHCHVGSVELAGELSGSVASQVLHKVHDAFSQKALYLVHQNMLSESYDKQTDHHNIEVICNFFSSR